MTAYVKGTSKNIRNGDIGPVRREIELEPLEVPEIPVAPEPNVPSPSAPERENPSVPAEPEPAK